jgi:hypothetical protein
LGGAEEVFVVEAHVGCVGVGDCDVVAERGGAEDAALAERGGSAEESFRGVGAVEGQSG